MASLLLVFAHPDDESFFCAGAVAKYSRLGHAVYLACATRGESGWDGRQLKGEAREPLGKVRERELKRAAQILGIRRIYFLDFLDGQLKSLEPEVIANKILAVIDLTQPDVIIGFGENGISQHPDHQTMGRVMRELFLEKVKLYEVCLPITIVQKVRPNWAGEPGPNISTIVNIENTWFLKKQALRTYASQKENVEKVFGPGVEPAAKELKKFEYFKRVYPAWQEPSLKEEELL